MKKILFGLVLLTSFTLANAQEDNSSKDDNLGFRFGLQISPELGWMKAQDKLANTSSPKFGFSYGLMFDYNIARNYSFSTGIYISQMSSTLDYTTDTMYFNSFKNLAFTEGTKVEYNKLQYVEVPISLKLKTNEIGYITYFGQFGFQGGLNIRAKGDISDKSGQHNLNDENLNPDIGLGNVSLLLGAGIEYSLSDHTSAMLGLNFVNGFLDVTDNPKGYKSKVALNQFALRLGIFF